MSARIGKNIFSLGISRIVSGVISFYASVRLAGYLAPQGFGKFSLVLAYYTIFLLIMDLGISRFVLKKVSEDKNLASQYLGNFLTAQAFLSLLIMALFILIPKVLGYEAEIAKSMLLAGASLLIGSFAIPFSTVIQAWQKIHIVAVVNFVNTILRAAWIFLAIILQKDLVFVFWAYVIVSLEELLIYAFISRSIVRPSFALEKTLVKKMFLAGVPFALISGFEILISKVDSVIQKLFLPFSDVGLYSVAYRFLDFLTFIPAIVAISLFPYIAGRVGLQDDETRQTFNRWNRYMVALSVPLGIGAAFLGDKIILALFGSEYAGSSAAFRILIWAAVLTFIYAVPNIIMIVKRTKLTVLVLGGVTLFNIAGNFLLIPKYGILASAWLTIVSYLLVGLFYIQLARKESPYELFRYFPKPLLAAAVMGAALWFLKDLNIFALVAVGVGVYGFTLLGLRFIRKDDWNFVKSIVLKEKA